MSDIRKTYSVILKTTFFRQYITITAKLRPVKNSITTLTKTGDNKFNLYILYINLLYLGKYVKTGFPCYTVIVPLNSLIHKTIHYNTGLLYSCYSVIV